MLTHTGITAHVTISRMQCHDDTTLQEIPYDVPETRPAGTETVAGDGWDEVEIHYCMTGLWSRNTTVQLHRSTKIGALYAFVAQQGGPTMRRFKMFKMIGEKEYSLVPYSVTDLEMEEPMGTKISTIRVVSHALKVYTHQTPAKVVFSSSFNLEDVFGSVPSDFYTGYASAYTFDVSAMHPSLLSQEDTDGLIHHEISVHLTRPDNSVAWLVSKAFTLDIDHYWAYAGNAHLCGEF